MFSSVAWLSACTDPEALRRRLAAGLPFQGQNVDEYKLLQNN